MKFFYTLIVGVTTISMLAACSTNTAKKSAPPSANKNGQTAKESYVERKSPFFSSIIISSTNNECIDQFNFIRGNKTDTYKLYSADYAKIGDGYRFLTINQNIMGKEAKEVYTMQLDLKLDTLCSKAHYTSYQIIKDKMRLLANI
ncbi:hypothetical protein ACQYRI_19020 [Salmonella enterica]